MKTKISGLILLILGTALSGLEQYPVAALMGAVPAVEPITELGVINDLKGGAYVLSIAGEALTLIRGAAGGSLGPYEIPDFPGPALRARNLQLSATGPVQYAAFIGGRGLSEGVCVLGLDHRGELVYYPVPETETPGPISEFIITGQYDGSAELYLLGDGRLSCVTGIGRRDKLRVYQSLSLNGETVEAFGIIEDIRQGPRYGWYRIQSGENSEVIVFSLSENGILKRDRLGIYSGDVRVSYGLAFDRTIILTLINKSRVEVFRETGAGFLRSLSFNVPVPVKRYYPPDQIGGNMGILTGGSGGEEQVYGVFYENTGTPVLKEWLSIRDGSVMDMIYAGNKQLAILYEDGEGWHSALVDLADGFLGERPIRGAESGARLLYSGGLGEISLCMGDKKDGGRLLFYGLAKGGDWELLRQMPIPENIWETGIKGEDILSLNPFYFKPSIVPLASPAGLVLYEAETGAWQSITGIKRNWSRRINDRILLAVYTGRELALYRMEG
ncbi:MAG: hypothetical protein LBP93_09655 [Treponema sp.]|jgi:hypothetical protein|nr:hypothetical protein [Treponema sp.]